MRTSPASWLLATLLAAPVVAWGEEPLAAIDWLRRNPPQLPPAGQAPYEPPIADAVHAPEIVVTALDDAPTARGLVPSTVTGLPVTLWRASETGTLVRLFLNVPVRHNPAMQSVLYTLLLAEGIPPEDEPADHNLVLAQIDRLMREGAVDPAEALARQAGPTRSAALFKRWFDASLLIGSEDAACAALSIHPHLAPDYAARIFCSARRGDWPAAVVMLDSARALGDVPPEQALLLERFLHADSDGLLPPPPVPSDLDPLTFKLYQAIGEPMTTRSLPRAYAHADLGDLSGWKAQLEAAERLARTGALGANRFLGIYTEREPAASGGVWDRVAAVQAFEAALNAGDAGDIAHTLGPAWTAMRSAETEIVFAELFAKDLAAHRFDDPQTAQLAWEIGLLGADHPAAAQAAPQDPRSQFLASVARGAPIADPNGSGLRNAIAAGFQPDAPVPLHLANLIDDGALGEVILRAIAMFEQGANGNPQALSGALATLRRVGLDDVCRAATLQLMLLEPRK